MKVISMSGSLRENVGKKASKALRKEGLVPCVVYGGEKQIHFSMNVKAFSKLIFTPETFIVNLEIGEEKIKCILQDVHYHPVSDDVIHVDFLQLIEGREVKVSVPVRVEGSAVGVVSGGKLITMMRKVKVQAEEANLPEFVTVDVTNLEIGQSVTIAEIELDNFKVLEMQTNVVAGVRTTRAAVSALNSGEEGEEGAEGAEGTEAAAE